MKIYNTLSRKVEEFIPVNKDMVTMYTCGPTVYSYAHIGNLRSYIAEDILEKTLRYLGYNVKRVMNITDVGHLSGDTDDGEDKMVKSAEKEKKTVLDIAKIYTDAFFEDSKSLNIKKPEIVVPATTMIDDYIKMIEVLLEKGYAYKAGDNVYFDTSKLDNYYVLTNHKEDELVVGVRDGVDEDLNKKNKTDFVLWFTKSKFQNQELKWDSPWGYGYPGWHIECSCISLANLGENLDIHCGGVDNIFPHHTNEIAQSESFLGHKWCNYWMHVEYLNNQDGKMSKSKGQTLTVSVLKDRGYNPLSYRFLCLQSHYRKQILFSFDNLDNAENAYKKLKNKCLSLFDDGELDKDSFDLYKNRFAEYLADDLNTASAISVLYDVLKSDINDYTKKMLIKSFDEVFSLDLLTEDVNKIDLEFENYILSKIEERKLAKINKDYASADAIREELLTKGVKLIDTKDGTNYEIM